MESHPSVKFGYYVSSRTLNYLKSQEEIEHHLSEKSHFNGRILFALADYLVHYSKQFDAYSIVLTDERDGRSRNGTLTGVLGRVNRSEVDIGVYPQSINDNSTKVVDFAYPFRFSSFTFATHKPEYEPQTFGILQTFSTSLWLTVLSVLIVLSSVYYSLWKRKYAFSEILLHVLAVLVRQSAVLRASSAAENLIVYSWVVGAMFMCLAYDSVFLSFLAFPPLVQIKDIPQLAAAVQKGDYHGIASPGTGVKETLLLSNDTNLRIIGRDMHKNNLTDPNLIVDFFYEKHKQKHAYLLQADVIGLFAGTKFVSEDRFCEYLPAMILRRDFCCKESVNTFVHRIMASGLYFKYDSDAIFLFRINLFAQLPQKEGGNRILTLTDLAPAFLILLMGWFVSILVFIGERVSGRAMKPKRLKKIDHRNKTAPTQSYRL